jgi:hypothetical protein
MKTWIISTIIVGSIFYVLCGNVANKYKKIVNKNVEIVNMYESLLMELSE